MEQKAQKHVTKNFNLQKKFSARSLFSSFGGPKDRFWNSERLVYSANVCETQQLYKCSYFIK